MLMIRARLSLFATIVLGIIVAMTLLSYMVMVLRSDPRAEFVEQCASAVVAVPGRYLSNSVVADCNKMWDRRQTLDANGWQPTSPVF